MVKMRGMQLWDTKWKTGAYGTEGDWAISPPPPPPGLEIDTRATESATETELIYNSGGLESIDPLATAILLALFTDARLPDSMVGQFGFTRADQHEYHGNCFSIDASQGEEELGSLLWTLRRAPLVPYTGKLAEHFCALALQPLVRQGWIGSYTIESEINKPAGQLSLLIRTYEPDRQFVADIAPLK